MSLLFSGLVLLDFPPYIVSRTSFTGDIKNIEVITTNWTNKKEQHA
jgi:hypothetical protein